MTEQSAPLDMLARDDPRLRDPAVLEEIELYAELMIAAGASGSALSSAEIDEVLGVCPVSRAGRERRRPTD